LHQLKKNKYRYLDYCYFAFIFIITAFIGYSTLEGSVNIIQLLLTEPDALVTKRAFFALLSGNFSNSSAYYGLSTPVLIIILLFPILVLLGIFDIALSFQTFGTINKLPALLAIPITTLVIHFILRKHVSRWIAYLAPLIILGSRELIQWTYSIHPDNPQLGYTALVFLFLSLAWEASQKPVVDKEASKFGYYLFFAILFSSFALGTKIFAVFIIFPVLYVVYSHSKSHHSKHLYKRQNCLRIACSVIIMMFLFTCLFSPNYLLTTADIVDQFVTAKENIYCSFKENILYLIPMKFFLLPFNQLGGFAIVASYVLVSAFDFISFLKNKTLTFRLLFHSFIIPFLGFYFLLNRDTLSILSFERFLMSYVFFMLIPVFHFLNHFTKKHKAIGVVTTSFILAYSLLNVWFGYGIKYNPQKTIMNGAVFLGQKMSCSVQYENYFNELFDTTGDRAHIKVLNANYKNSPIYKKIFQECGFASSFDYGKIYQTWFDKIKIIQRAHENPFYIIREWLSKRAPTGSVILSDRSFALLKSECFASCYDFDGRTIIEAVEYLVTLRDFEGNKPTHVITTSQRGVDKILNKFPQYSIVKTLGEITILENKNALKNNLN